MTSRIFPVSMVLGFIDGLRYLMMSPEDFDRKFNKKYYQERPRRRRTKKKDYYEMKGPSKKRPTRRSRTRQNPFKKSGVRKYKEYDIEEAIDDFKKGLKIEPNDIALDFNLACAYSLLENKEEAFNHLDSAVKNGLKDYEKILNHEDLAFVRIQPEFEDFKNNQFQIQTKKKEKEPEETNQPMDDVLLAQLNRLMELRKKGVLTENEYVIERKKILYR